MVLKLSLIKNPFLHSLFIEQYSLRISTNKFIKFLYSRFTSSDLKLSFLFFFFFLRNVKNVHSSVLTETSFEEVLFLKHWNQLKSSSNIFRSLCTVLTFEQYQQHISIVSHTLRDVHFTSTHMYACFTRCYIPKLTFFRTIIGARNCQPTSNRKKTHR